MRVRDTSPEARRLLEAFDLYEFGRAMQVEQIRRRYPDAPEAEITQRLRDLLREADERAGFPANFVRTDRLR